MTFISYAQNFEDVILRRCFKSVSFGFYVDVGAWEPMRDSTTKSFYDLGWSGINIEPSPAFDVLAAARPLDINLRLAVSDHSGVSKLFYEQRFFDSGASSEILGTANLNGNSGPVLEGCVRSEADVETRTLESILDEYANGKHIHFMKIDVEGAEYKVLNGINLSIHRPEVVVVEATAPTTCIRVDSNWSHLLTKHGYTEVLFDGLNCWYLSEDSSICPSVFELPPNVFDDFAVSSLVSTSRIRDSISKSDKEILDLRCRTDLLTRELVTANEDKETASIRAAAFESLVFTLEAALAEIHEGGIIVGSLPISKIDSCPPLRAPTMQELLEQLEYRCQQLTASGLFDPQWYLLHNPDVAIENMDPLVHFLLHGSFELRSPGPLLDSVAYLNRYPDVSAAEMEPWIHFMLHGREEGRSGH